MTDAVDTANELNERLISAELAEMRQRQAERDKALSDARTARTARNGQDGLSDSHCIDCGATISEGRLKAMPYAVRCIVCQNELEMG